MVRISYPFDACGFFRIADVCFILQRKGCGHGVHIPKKTENKEKTKMIDFIWDCIVEVFRNGDEH